MSLIKELAAHFPQERVKTRPIDLHAWSSDASFYSLVPQAVVFPADEEEVRFLLELAGKYHTSVTFRTAGTSLSGQSVTSGILADLSRSWKGSSVQQDGEAVRVEPGLTGQTVNRILKPYGRKIGPDPASIQAAMMGGILSNNSSGMCCGVINNSYHTLLTIRFLLPDGRLYDTGIATDYGRFEKEAPGLFSGMVRLRDRVRNNQELVTDIRRKYRMKNTVGYSLNAFVDFEHPLDILAHLLIGAEGTLGFIASALLKTIPDLPFKTTGLLFFPDPKTACDAIGALTDSGAEALEFMDRAALRSIEDGKDAPAFLKALPAGAACILCEYQAESEASLQEKFTAAGTYLATLPVIRPAEFTRDPYQQAIYWKLRKGMYPSVAAVRARGTSVMLEDVAVPVASLGAAIVDLQALFTRFGYDNALVFGHAKEGNLHFLVSQSIKDPEDIRLFEAFNDELAALIIHTYKGSLKAEHGTGRQIAPYVEDEWGVAAYQVMKDLKELVDPGGILNPGVIINPDKKCHLKNLKSLPVVEEEVDKCVECGYCEHRCPSREYTLTPRQRIVLRRSLVRLKEAGDQKTYESIVKDYQHDGLDTCAVDGLCALECPVDINTGDLVKRLRRENHSVAANNMALRIARHFGKVENSVRLVLRAGNGLNRMTGTQTMTRLSRAIRKILPAFPLYPPLPMGPADLPVREPQQPEAVYFTCCMNRMMGSNGKDGQSVADALLRVADKANVPIAVPSGSKGLCCGQAFSSKGFTEAYKHSANEMITSLWNWTCQGTIPVVLDITSCTYSLQHSRPFLTEENQRRFDALQIMDGLDFAVNRILPRLTISHKKEKIVLHPVCSLYKMGLVNQLNKLGQAVAGTAVIPVNAGCCGMAGDRGFYYPELTLAATRQEGTAVKEQACNDCYSTARPCELAMSGSTGKDYRSIFHLLDEVSS